MNNEGTKKEVFTERELESLIRRFDSSELTISTAYGDGGVNGVWRRFERAAIGQCGRSKKEVEYLGATVSRYAIWANTVRDNIIAGLDAVENGHGDEAREMLIRAANSLSAFSELQAHFDPLND
jgi:hypothetical protein